MSDLPRLLLCSFDVIPGPSGSSRRLTEYLKALPDRFSVVVLSAKTPDHSHIEKYQGARLLRVPVGSGDLASRIQAFERAVRRQLESEEYALAHFTDPFGGYALCELKADYGYRLIYEAQTFPSQELRYTHPQTDGDRRFLSKIRRQELFCLMNADLIVTGSQTTRAFIQGLGAAEEQLRVLRAPVDLAPYAPDALGAPDGTPLRMMYLGSQVGWQGLPTLMRAMALAAQQVDVRLTVVGAPHPDWKPHLEDLVAELGLREKVEFQPPVGHDDLAKVLALADVGVLPLDDSERNRVQGGPLAKVSEYLAAGRPVIASDLPVTRELVPASAATFFPPGDSRALADRIIELARDVPRRVTLGREARAYAEEVLDAGLIRGKLLDLYDGLLEKRGTVPVEAASEPPDMTMTGTPTNRLATLGISEPPREQPAPAAPAEPPASASEAPPDAPAREDLPLVMGMVLDEGLDTRLVKTEPDARPIEPPVVMGLPLREKPAPDDEAPTTVGTQPGAPEPAPTRESASTAADERPPPVAEAPAAPQPAEEAPPEPTPIVRRTASPPPEAREDEPPAPTPIVRRPVAPRSEPHEDELPAPTPIVRRPTPPPQRAHESPEPTPIVRAPAPRADEDELPAPTPIVAMRSLTSSRHGTGRPSRGPASSEFEKPPIRGGTGAEPERPSSSRLTALHDADKPPIRGGLTAEPARTSSTRLPALNDADKPPIRGGLTGEPSRPSSTRLPALNDADKPPIRGGSLSDSDRPPPLPPRAAAPPPVPPRQPPPRLMPTEPPRLTPSEPPRLTPSEPPRLMPAEPPRLTPSEPPRLTPTEPPRLLPTEPPRPAPPMLKASVPAHVAEPENEPEDEPEEISSSEALPLDEDDSGPTPAHASPRLDEAEEISSDEAVEAEADESPADAEPDAEEEGPSPEPPGSALNPWFAQLAHGYCPPEGTRFARHTPPTTFPGRDDDTDPSRVPPEPRSQGTVRGRNS